MHHTPPHMSQLTITVKRTSGEASTQLTVDATLQITALKQRIGAELGLPSTSKQRLVHKGRILADEQTLESYNVASGETILVQVIELVAHPHAITCVAIRSCRAPPPLPRSQQPLWRRAPRLARLQAPQRPASLTSKLA
jgi:hypothetical protein